MKRMTLSNGVTGSNKNLILLHSIQNYKIDFCYLLYLNGDPDCCKILTEVLALPSILFILK